MRQITYPPVDIGAETAPSFLGRNGMFRAVGVSISQPVPSIVQLVPTTSRQHPARCIIELPADPVTLKELAGELLHLAMVADRRAV